MPYIPKSKYSIKSTNGGELYNPQTGNQYRGEYIQYGTRYFAGNSITDLSIKLEKLETNNTHILNTERNFLYNQLNKKFYQKIKNQKPPRAQSQTPTEDDYKRGRWERYFYQRVTNENQIFETDKKTHTELRSNKLDGALYKPGKIVWSLTSKEENIINVLKLKRKFLYIDALFNNPGEFVR